MNLLNTKKQNKKWGEYGEKTKNTGTEGEVKEGAASRGDLGKDSLYCVDQPGSRLKRKARDSGQLFENLTWLTANEAAEYLRLPSVGMFRVLVCKRQIPLHKLGRRLRFRKIELDRLIETSRNRGV